MMEAGRTSETSVYFKENARRYIQEGCRLLTVLTAFTVTTEFVSKSREIPVELKKPH
jgi:hypothetical protein